MLQQCITMKEKNNYETMIKAREKKHNSLWFVNNFISAHIFVGVGEHFSIDPPNCISIWTNVYLISVTYDSSIYLHLSADSSVLREYIQSCDKSWFFLLFSYCDANSLAKQAWNTVFLDCMCSMCCTL